MLSIRDAAKEAKVSRSAIFRAIKAGKISAPRRENGDYAIDPSELFRVFDPRSTEGGKEGETWDGAETCPVRQGEQGSETNSETVTTLRVRVASLEAELRAQRDLITRLDQRERDLQADREAWREQATRLVLAPPRRRSWWPW